jgi:hypothetical protein
MRSLVLLLLTAVTALAEVPTPLWSRGYSVIPTPQTVKLEAGDVALNTGWTLTEATPAGIAAESLVRDFAGFHGISLRKTVGARQIVLKVAAGTVKTTPVDPELAAQAYRLTIADNRIEITGNAAAGLFYGVQTLIQLPRRDSAGRLWLPKGSIEDWPRLQLRFLHWDTKHHQNRMETMKRYIDWTARFKANMIGFELEDKFEYPSNPEIGAPGAYTTKELQEITDYALARHIQLVPEIQSPAHMAYVLKHPKFAHLKADGSNYQSALCDPRTYDLIFSMYDDIIKANKGVKYFFVSTDEVYYAGIEATCRPYTPENRSLAWVEFVKRARKHLAKQGRRILVWDEYPLLAQHVEQIPPDVIGGVMGEADYLPTANRIGMRHLAYVSMQGAEYLFPSHLGGETASRRGSENGYAQGRLRDAYDSIRNGRHWQNKPIGTFGAAWDDSGLHDETFWLGWSAVANWGWNPGPGAASPAQHAAEFMRVYYGPNSERMIEVYRALQRQSRAWERTWETITSKVRGPGYGNSYAKGVGTRREDITLAAPPLPQLPDLSLTPSVATKYGRFIEEAQARAVENDELMHAIETNLGRADRNQYNLEVFLSLTDFIGHHWRLLGAMSHAEQQMVAARSAARAGKHELAVGHLVGAYTAIDRARQEGERTFADLTQVWEKARYPKGRAVSGRQFVHVLDDVKDHFADRTVDLGYMAAPERQIGLAQWTAALQRVIEDYAKAHNVPVKGIGPARLEE